MSDHQIKSRAFGRNIVLLLALSSITAIAQVANQGTGKQPAATGRGIAGKDAWSVVEVRGIGVYPSSEGTYFLKAGRAPGEFAPFERSDGQRVAPNMVSSTLMPIEIVIKPDPQMGSDWGRFSEDFVFWLKPFSGDEYTIRPYAMFIRRSEPSAEDIAPKVEYISFMLCETQQVGYPPQTLVTSGYSPESTLLSYRGGPKLPLDKLTTKILRETILKPDAFK